MTSAGRPHGSTATLAVALTLIASGWALASSARGASPVLDDDPALECIEDALEGLESWTEVPACARALVACGPEVLPHLFGALAGTGALDVTLTEARAAAVRSAVRAHPEAVLRDFLERLAEDATSDAHRAEGVRLLGRFAQVDDVLLLSRLAAGSASHVPRDLQVVFEAAVHRVLKSDPRSLGAVPGVVDRVHPSLREALVRAVGREDSPAALDALAAMLGRGGVDPLVLLEIGRLARARRGPIDADVRDRVRWLLASADPELAGLATIAIGRLNDTDAVPELIRSLQRPEPALRALLTDALHQLTGRRLGEDPEVWADWYERELEWWVMRSEESEGRIRAGTVNQAIEAITDMAGRRLFPDQLAGILVRGLERDEEPVVQGACVALGNVRSESALADLVWTLEDPRPDVARAAHAALEKITGRRLAPDPELWRSRLRLDAPVR